MQACDAQANEPPLQTSQEYLTVAEVAAVLKTSKDTVLRRFAGRAGVLNLGTPETLHKRRYRSLRIPRTALNEFIVEVSR